jgi:hypothetical protein
VTHLLSGVWYCKLVFPPYGFLFWCWFCFWMCRDVWGSPPGCVDLRRREGEPEGLPGRAAALGNPTGVEGPQGGWIGCLFS